MDNESIHGLRLDQLAHVFSLGVGDPDPACLQGDDERLAGRLRDQLSCVPPGGSLLADSLAMMVGRLGYEVQAAAGRSLQEVLLSAQTDLGLLQAIKDCSKRLSAGLDSKTEAAMATTIYYAALASALVHHDRRITRRSYDELERSFMAFAARKWIPPELAVLFQRAGDHCRGNRAVQDSPSPPHGGD